LSLGGFEVGKRWPRETEPMVFEAAMRLLARKTGATE
jgi:hypothetical protein